MRQRFALLLPLYLLFAKTGASATYNILDYGAVKNELSTPAIQKAVDACHAGGGGTVLVPAGTFVTGTITLKSHVDLHLEHGALLIGSLNLDDYARRRGIIFCEDAEQVSITGAGTINARGIDFYDATQNHVYDEFDRNLTRQKQGYMPEGQFYSDGPIKRKPRPGMTITFYNCTNVNFKDFTLLDTPVWAIRLAYCEDVFVNGLTILNNLLIPNSDGIHSTASRNVRISHCNIRAGDDAIIVTGFDIDEETPEFSMKEQEEHTFGNKSKYAENFVVTDCLLQSRSAGIRVGYGQHPIRRCTFSNIHIYGSNRGIGIFAHDLTDIEELKFSNITIETRLHNGQWWGNAEPIHISAISRFAGHKAGTVKNVTFDNITATSEHGILLYGLAESRLENIKLNNVHVKIVNGVETLTYGGNFDLRPTAIYDKQLFEHNIPGLYAQWVNGLTLDDFSLEWGENLPAFFTHGIECVDVTDLSPERVDAEANPNCAGCPNVKLERTSYKRY